jgi:hypothetical protein
MIARTPLVILQKSTVFGIEYWFLVIALVIDIGNGTLDRSDDISIILRVDVRRAETLEILASISERKGS